MLLSNRSVLFCGEGDAALARCCLTPLHLHGPVPLDRAYQIEGPTPCRFTLGWRSLETYATLQQRAADEQVPPEEAADAWANAWPTGMTSHDCSWSPEWCLSVPLSKEPIGILGPPATPEAGFPPAATPAASGGACAPEMCTTCGKKVPSTSMGGDGDPEDCKCPRCICLGLVSDEASEALQCGHVLHTSCLQRWMKISGKPKEAACPHKCYTNNLSGTGDGFESAILSEAESESDNDDGQDVD